MQSRREIKIGLPEKYSASASGIKELSSETIEVSMGWWNAKEPYVTIKNESMGFYIYGGRVLYDKFKKCTNAEEAEEVFTKIVIDWLVANPEELKQIITGAFEEGVEKGQHLKQLEICHALGLGRAYWR